MDTFGELIKALDSEDDLGKVIRSQIIVENIIVQYIESQVKDVNFLNKMDLTFEQKTNLALAFGLDKDWGAAIGCLGKLRNTFAHRLRGEITKSDANNFYKTFSPKNKNITQELCKSKENDLKEVGIPTYPKMEPVHKFSLYLTVLSGALQAWLDHRGKEA